MRVRGDDRSFRPSGEGRLFPGSPKRMFGGRGLEGLQIGGADSLARRGDGAIQKKAPSCCRPSTSGSIQTNQWAGGGGGVPLSFSPPPPTPAVQDLRDRHSPGTRAHGPTPQRVSQSRTHHTYTAANKRFGHPCPLPPPPPAGEGGASPPQLPCKVSFGLRAAVGRGTWSPGGRWPGWRGFPDSPRKPVLHPVALRGLQACLRSAGGVGRTPDAGDSRVGAEVSPWPRDWS